MRQNLSERKKLFRDAAIRYRLVDELRAPERGGVEGWEELRVDYEGAGGGADEVEE